MIDRKARNRLAEEIRHFVAGLNDNFKFDDAAWSIQSDDAGVLNIRQAMWFTYDDLIRHKLKGRQALNEQDRKAVARYILFLKSDFEYRWPETPKPSLLYIILRIFSFGHATRNYYKKWEESGDYEVWPFLTVEEFEEAKRNPAYCANTKGH